VAEREHPDGHGPAVETKKRLRDVWPRRRCPTAAPTPDLHQFQRQTAFLDKMNFSVLGQAVEGRNVVEALPTTKYGDGAPWRIGPDQGRLQAEGNTSLKASSPISTTSRRARFVNMRPIRPGGCLRRGRRFWPHPSIARWQGFPIVDSPGGTVCALISRESRRNRLSRLSVQPKTCGKIVEKDDPRPPGVDISSRRRS
jgi:hypothetical protein